MTHIGCGCAALSAEEIGESREKPAGKERFTWPAEGKRVRPRDDGRVHHKTLLDELGLKGVFDAHSHWFPETVMRKIWEHFDRYYWPVTYRQLPEGRLEWVRRNRIHHFTTLNYAHRPGMAAWLNEYSAEFASSTPEAVPCGTFYQEPGAVKIVRQCIEEYHFRGFKLHLRVSGMDPTQTGLHPAFEQIEAAGLPVVIHAGSAPDPGTYTAPAYMEGLLKQFPRLKVVIAHMGGWEWEKYLSLAERHEGVYLDTAMVFVRFQALDPYPPALMARLEKLSRKILFGSDFPNIPYPLSHAVESIGHLPFDAEAKRGILFDNAAALFGINGSSAG